MDLSTLQNWLWKAACSIRGEVDAARYKDYILPLIFYKRLNDVYADKLVRVARDLGVDVVTARQVVETDYSLVRYFLDDNLRWERIRGKTTVLGELIIDHLRVTACNSLQLVGETTPVILVRGCGTSASWTTHPGTVI